MSCISSCSFHWMAALFICMNTVKLHWIPTFSTIEFQCFEHMFQRKKHLPERVKRSFPILSPDIPFYALQMKQRWIKKNFWVTAKNKETKSNTKMLLFLLKFSSLSIRSLQHRKFQYSIFIRLLSFHAQFKPHVSARCFSTITCYLSNNQRSFSWVNY